MEEKVLRRKDMEEIFLGFEKRQDVKFEALEGRIDQRMTTLEERIDQKMTNLEERMDQKMTSLEGRIDQKMTNLEGRVVDQFHIVSEGLMDQIKLLAEGHAGVIERLSGLDKRLDRMETENERQHLETRALVKLSFSELDRRLTDLEFQMKEMKEWKKQVEARLLI